MQPSRAVAATDLSSALFAQEQRIGVEEYEALCKGTRNLTPPPITDELSRWVNETQWSALQPLTQLPVSDPNTSAHACNESVRCYSVFGQHHPQVCCLSLYCKPITNPAAPAESVKHSRKCLAKLSDYTVVDQQHGGLTECRCCFCCRHMAHWQRIWRRTVMSGRSGAYWKPLRRLPCLVTGARSLTSANC